MLYWSTLKHQISFFSGSSRLELWTDVPVSLFLYCQTTPPGRYLAPQTHRGVTKYAYPMWTFTPFLVSGPEPIPPNTYHRWALPSSFHPDLWCIASDVFPLLGHASMSPIIPVNWHYP